MTLEKLLKRFASIRSISLALIFMFKIILVHCYSYRLGPEIARDRRLVAFTFQLFCLDFKSCLSACFILFDFLGWNLSK